MFYLKQKPIADNNVPWGTIDLSETQSEMDAHLARLDIGFGMQAAVFDGGTMIGEARLGDAGVRNIEDEADAEESGGGW